MLIKENPCLPANVIGWPRFIRTNMTKTILAFYKFLHLKNPQKEKARLLAFLEENSTVGTIILSYEGINGMCSLDQDKTEKVKSFLKKNFRLTRSDFKENLVSSNVFKKLSVKVKKEIVTLGIPEIDPTAIVGTYIEPEEWDSFISKKEVITIDTRNDFEVELGTFEGSVNPQTVSFHEFVEWWKDKGKALKNKKIAMFCTGGIRCEKATSLLKSEGLEEVYHLKGGILNYFDKVGNSETSTWKGDCFVFDQRVTVNSHLKPGDFELCHACRSPLRLTDKNHEHYEQGVSCHKCFGTKTDKKILSLKERKKQIDLLKDRRNKNE